MNVLDYEKLNSFENSFFNIFFFPPNYTKYLSDEKDGPTSKKILKEFIFLSYFDFYLSFYKLIYKKIKNLQTK